MQTVRRVYFYLVTLISLEVVVWGVIYLARTLFDDQSTTASSNLLATGLSLILVGLPIFLLHWVIIQSNALRNVDERSTLVRAVFLYAVQLAVLIPVVQNVLAIFTRAIMSVLDINARTAFIGGQQTLLDNLVAIIVNLVAWAYFTHILRADWQAGLDERSLTEVRRLYRYIWMLYGLVLMIAGVQSLLRYVLLLLNGTAGVNNNLLGNGIPMAAVGGIIWSQAWRIIQRRDDDPAERQSTLRLVVLYVITLLSAFIVTITGVLTLTSFFRFILGTGDGSATFLSENAGQIALLIPLSILWIYYEGQRREHIAQGVDASLRPEMERLYGYIMALLGLIVTILGNWMLLETLIQFVFNARMSFIAEELLAPAMACLAIGVPLWLYYWLPLQSAARDVSQAGEQARRSLVRKIYLYIILFLSIIGVMVAGGRLFFLALSQVLGNTTPDFSLEFVRRLSTLLLITMWLSYHLIALRRDGDRTQRTLTERHVTFPTVIMQRGEDDFSDLVVDALQRQAPQLPVTVHRIESPITEDLMTAKAVVIPSTLAVRPPEALRIWLSEYRGRRIFVPQPLDGWIYLGAPSRTQSELAQDTATLLRELAEGEEARRPTALSPWVVAAIVVAGLIIVPPLLMLILSFLFAVR